MQVKHKQAKVKFCGIIGAKRSARTCSRDWSKDWVGSSTLSLENGGRRLTIAWPGLSAVDPLELGESVAVSGCCLTVTAAAGETFQVQAGPETLDRTNLGDRSAGDRVNLERALKVGDRLGGHFVQGHIDTTATLRDRRQEGEWEFLAFGIERVLDSPTRIQRIDRR